MTILHTLCGVALWVSVRRLLEQGFKFVDSKNRTSQLNVQSTPSTTLSVTCTLDDREATKSLIP